MENGLSERTPQIIAAEINSIKDQTGKMLLYSAIEIGRRLTEAKSVVNHGEWLKWLEDSVSYSKSTAENLMRLSEEYGSKLPADYQDSANSQTFGNLGYSQAVILLGIPEDERAKFMAENDVENMSARELQQAVKERDQALGKSADLQKTVDTQSGAITEITAERDSLKEKAAGFQEALKINQSTIKSLQQQVTTARTTDASEEKVAALEKDLKAARALVTANKVAFQLESMSKGFEVLLTELSKLAAADPETHEKYKHAVNELVRKVTEKL